MEPQTQDGSTVPPQRDSDEAPSSATTAEPVQLSLSDEERAGLVAEVERLQVFSVIGKVVGSRPSRGELRDLLQEKLLAEVGKIRDVQILGRGFYQVEFEEQESATKAIGMSPLLVRGARVHLRSWFHGFDPATDRGSLWFCTSNGARLPSDCLLSWIEGGIPPSSSTDGASLGYLSRDPLDDGFSGSQGYWPSFGVGDSLRPGFASQRDFATIT